MTPRPLPVLAVTSEIFPLVKTGGLADVAGALPGALANEGVAVTTLVPGYPAVLAVLGKARPVLDITDLFGGPARLLRGKASGLDLLALDAPHLYARDGNPYLGPDGRDWPDNARRFAALSAMAAAIGRGAVKGYRPRLVHAHDWQAGLTAAYLYHGGPNPPPSVFTVHNLAFQGQFPASLLPILGLPASGFRFDGFEHHGAIGYLKAGLQLASHVTTVSPTYANEIRTEAGGMGFDGLLRYRGASLSGILNGIDIAIWNPETDPLIAAPFSADNLKGRAACRAAIQQRFGLAPDRKALLFGVVSRLSWQKDLDLLADALDDLLALGAQLVLLGAGEPALEQRFRQAADLHPGRIGVRVGYDEALAHQIQAGVDALIVPSRFEPCGLTQLCALRYGTVPVVSRVGGLADTVEDGITGVVFDALTADGLRGALRRTADLFATPRRFAALGRAGMGRDVSWHGPARQYADLYRALVVAH
ncbi:MAG: glycogen synthase GlgA [Hyphomicrobiales bacterium]|nr:glycogen synthase GlgA [Hyphomicrobiales bacterium]